MKLYTVAWFDNNEGDYYKSVFPTKKERDSFAMEIKGEHDVLKVEEIEFSTASRRALCETLFYHLDVRG